MNEIDCGHKFEFWSYLVVLANWSKTTVDPGLLIEKKTMVGVVVKKRPWSESWSKKDHGHLPKKTGPSGLFEKNGGRLLINYKL